MAVCSKTRRGLEAFGAKVSWRAKKCGKYSAVTTCVTPLLVLSRAHTRQQSNHCGWNTAWGRLSAHLTMHMNTEHNQPHVENRKRQDVQHRQDKTHNVQSSKCSLSLDKVLVCSPPQVILFRPAGTTRLYRSNWTPPRKPTLISFQQIHFLRLMHALIHRRQ